MYLNRMSHNLTQRCLVELLIEICLFNPFVIVSQRAGMIDRGCALLGNDQDLAT